MFSRIEIKYASGTGPQDLNPKANQQAVEWISQNEKRTALLSVNSNRTFLTRFFANKTILSTDPTEFEN